MPANPHTTSLAKTTRPAFVQAVLRERLFGRLDEASQKPLVWLGGPAGAGKTTLVSSWIEQRRVGYLWYELDAGDADPATFLFYLAESARRRHEIDTGALPALSTLAGEDLAGFARRYFRALFRQLPSPLVMVLDNAQDAPPGMTLETLMLAAVAEMPRSLCMVVASRTDVPASMARLRASEALVSIAAGELRLNREEIAAMALARGRPLAAQELDALADRTAGWPAAVVLLLEHAKLSGHIAEPPADPAPQVMFDYLGGEIFDRFEPPTRQLLLDIAPLPRISGDIARALSGNEGAEEILLNLARNAWFVSQTGANAEREFRLHPLLREFLAERVRTVADPSLHDAHLQRAAGLLETAGRIDEALQLTIDAGDFESAARLLGEHAETIHAQGRTESLAQWLDELPHQAVTTDPTLLYWSARCRIATHPREARRLFQQACERSTTDGDPAGARIAAAGVIDALLAEGDDFSLLDPWIDTIQTASRDEPPTLDVLRATCLARAARAPVEARLRASRESLANALRTDPSAGPAARTELALVQALSGEPDLAIETLGETAGNDLDDGQVARAVARAVCHLVTGDTEQALAAIGPHPEARGLRGAWMLALRVVAAAMHPQVDDTAGADPTAADVEVAGSSIERLLQRVVLALRALHAGDTDTAYRQQVQALRAAVDLGAPFAEALCRAALAVTSAACGDERRSAAEIRRAQAIASQTANPLLVLECSLAESHLAFAERRDVDGERSLRQALGVGREHGLAPAPWWRAEHLAALCEHALETDVEPNYVRRIVRARALVPRGAGGAQAWPWPVRIHTLGGFRLAGEALPEAVSERAQGRGTELLKVLAALGGSAVRVENITQALWPHMDGDYAYRAFTATLHRLRRVLDVDDAVLLIDGRLTLNPRICWLDVRALEAVFTELDLLLQEPRARAGAERIEEAAARLLSCYGGAFLPDELEHASFLACRERLRARLLRCAGRLARRLEEFKAPERAADFLERAIDADPLCEGLYRHLMESYARLGRKAELTETYQRLCTVMLGEPRGAPATETTALYERLSSSA